MLRLRIFLIAAAAALMTLATTSEPASAQAPAPKRNVYGYKPVAVTIPTATKDAKFDAFRKDLSAAITHKDRNALAKLVAKEIFWERDFGKGYDAKKSGLDNLAAAVGIETGDGMGWDILAGFAKEPTAGPHPERAGIVCSPAAPRYDDAEFQEVIKAAKSDSVDWSHPRAANVKVYAKAATSAPVIDTLGLHLVRVTGFDAKDTDVDPMRTAWAQVLTPSGKSGYVPPGSLMSLFVDRLCFVKEKSGNWLVAGYVGGGD